MTEIYCLDSGVFINSWTKHYPPDLFPCVWTHFDELCKNRKVVVPSEVFDEVIAIDDGVAKWLKQRKSVVMKATEEVILQQKQIVNQYKRLTAMGSNRSGADPWVIACALVKNAILVTEEQASGKLDKPKIPDVCSDLQIDCLNTIRLLRATGYCSNRELLNK